MIQPRSSVKAFRWWLKIHGELANDRQQIHVVESRVGRRMDASHPSAFDKQLPWLLVFGQRFRKHASGCFRRQSVNRFFANFGETTKLPKTPVIQAKRSFLSALCEFENRSIIERTR